MSEVRTDGIFTRDDLLQIEQTLYAAKKEELVARNFLNVNQNFASYASEIGYDYYEGTGEASVIAAGSTADDSKFVGENGGRTTLKVLEIRTALRFTESERNMVNARRAFGKGPSVQLDTIRVATARRLVAEMENKIAFVGNTPTGTKGLLNSIDILAADVADGATGTGLAKKNWTNKTSEEILTDLLFAKTDLEKDGHFKGKVLALPPEKRMRLLKPYSTNTTMTILQWLQSEGMFFEKIIDTNALSKLYNGLKISTTAVDAFLLLDNSPENVELGVPQDLTIREPIVDKWGTSEQGVFERTTGIILRHPKAIYVGKGI